MNEQLGESVAGLLGAIFCNVDVTSDASVDAGFAKARAVHGQERILITWRRHRQIVQNRLAFT